MNSGAEKLNVLMHGNLKVSITVADDTHTFSGCQAGH